MGIVAIKTSFFLIILPRLLLLLLQPPLCWPLESTFWRTCVVQRALRCSGSIVVSCCSSSSSSSTQYLQSGLALSLGLAFGPQKLSIKQKELGSISLSLSLFYNTSSSSTSSSSSSVYYRTEIVLKAVFLGHFPSSQVKRLTLSSSHNQILLLAPICNYYTRKYRRLLQLPHTLLFL